MMNGYGMGLWWVLWTLLLVAGIGALVWGLVRASSPTRTEGSTGDGRARRILEERFARGEIGEEEFRQRLRILDEH